MHDLQEAREETEAASPSSVWWCASLIALLHSRRFVTFWSGNDDDNFITRSCITLAPLSRRRMGECGDDLYMTLCVLGLHRIRFQLDGGKKRKGNWNDYSRLFPNQTSIDDYFMRSLNWLPVIIIAGLFLLVSPSLVPLAPSTIPTSKESLTI